MTEHATLPDEYYPVPVDDQTVSPGDDFYADSYPGETLQDAPNDDPFDDDWYQYPVEYAPQQERTPWFRNPRLLLALIGLAAAALVVASVLLVSGRRSSEPTAPTQSVAPTADSSAPRAPLPSHPPATPTPSSSPEDASPSPEPSDEPLPDVVGPPEVTAESPAAPTATASKHPAGPRINVTRNPMSFAPGKH